MSWIYYLLEANFYLVVFYLLYYFLFRRETYYQLNRLYLLTSSILAFVIPFFQLGILKPAVAPVDTNAIIQILQPTAVKTAPVITSPDWSMENLCMLAYLLIVSVLFINLALKIYKLVRLSRNNKNTVIDAYKLVETSDESGAFSFFNYLFISAELSHKQTIIRHELVHVRQRHSWDIMFFEMIKIINWFNPIAYLLQHSIKELHEFIADRETVEQEHNMAVYTDFLVNNAYGITDNMLTNTFFNKSLIKKRIIMLHQQRSGKSARLKYLLAMPLCVALLTASTLGFSKNYGFIDLAPAHEANKALPQAVKTDVAPLNKVTPKGYKYTETGYLIDGKADFRVIITEKDGTKKDYFRNSATKNMINLLKEKYGYAFPTMEIYPKLPPPPPGPSIDKRPPPPPPAPPKKAAVKFPPPVVETKVYTAVEKAPEFPGGLDAFGRFLARTVKYPAKAKKEGIQGKVFIKFIVEKNGSISNVSVIHGVSEDLDKEAVRAMHASPKWKPGFQNGKAVRTEYSVPISFTLAGVEPPKNKTDDKAEVYDVNNHAPEFPGGLKEFGLFLAKNIKYPESARAKNIQGKVFIKFIVEKDGALSNIAVIRGVSEDIDKEALRVMNMSPKWKPAVKNGEAVSTEYSVPIGFTLAK